MRKYFTGVLISCCLSNIYAQNYSGKIVDVQTQNPLAFANVVLLQKQDSAFVAGAITDTLGNFSFNAIQNNYLLKISFIGYKTQFVEIENKNIGTINLAPDSEIKLSELTVTAYRPIYKLEDGGISTDIQNSRLKEIGNASDVLGQLPLVNKSGDDYTVFGKGEPLIYVNNRLLRSNSELERINSSQIKKVTVITNPSAEYDATTKAVIKIETLKVQGEGLSGSIYSRANTKQFISFGHSEMVDLNYRTKKLDLFGTVFYGDGEDITNTKGQLYLYQPERIFLSKETSKRIDGGQNYGYQAGAIYSINSDNEAGIYYDYNKLPDFIRHRQADMSIFINDIFQETLNSDQNAVQNIQTNYVNAYYNGKLTKCLSVKLDIDYANGNTDEDQTINNVYDNNTANKTVTFTNQNYNLFAAKLVLSMPLGKDNLNYGTEYCYTDNKQNLKIIERADAIDILAPSNNIAKQNLFAAFAAYSKKLSKFSINLGLRYENIDFQYFMDNQKQQEESKIYDNLFPKLNITYAINNIELMAGYNRTIKRPSYFQLRNRVMYDSPYWYETGNPLLKPTINNSITSSAKWKGFLFSANYAVLQQAIVFISERYQQDIILSKTDNLGNVKNLSLSAFYSKTVRFWQPSLELNMSKEFINYDNQTFNEPVYYIKLKNNFQFNKTFQIGLETNYTSCGNSDMYYNYDRFRIDVYLAKTFFNDNLRINFYGTDIFDTDRGNGYFNINNIYFPHKTDFKCRPRFSVSLSYRFNSTNSKYKGEQASDELNRL
ncbi:TonB-dependent receptor [Bacteroidia bacterium]|nr:TonB-dependent receptor [Bacteroidia bacterium]